MRKPAILVALLFMSWFLVACESDDAREQRYKAEAQRQVAEDDQTRQESFANQGAVTELALAKQHELDGVEQRRTGNVYAQSCRKAVAVNPGMPVIVDTKGCTPEQLRLETEAERRQMFDDALKNAKEDRN